MVVALGIAPARAVLLVEPDRTRGSKLAVYFRVSAFQTILAQVDLVFHAHHAGFDFGVAQTFSHIADIRLILIGLNFNCSSYSDLL